MQGIDMWKLALKRGRFDIHYQCINTDKHRTECWRCRYVHRLWRIIHTVIYSASCKETCSCWQLPQNNPIDVTMHTTSIDVRLCNITAANSLMGMGRFWNSTAVFEMQNISSQPATCWRWGDFGTRRRENSLLLSSSTYVVYCTVSDWMKEHSISAIKSSWCETVYLLKQMHNICLN